MWHALIGVTTGDDLTVVSSIEIKWGINRNDEVLFVFGEFDELVVPMNNVRFIRVYQLGVLV